MHIEGKHEVAARVQRRPSSVEANKLLCLGNLQGEKQAPTFSLVINSSTAMNILVASTAIATISFIN